MNDFAASLIEKFKGTFRKASDPYWWTDYCETGIAGADLVLGGGFGRGRISELYGGFSSGKTLLLYYALANNQRCIVNGKPGVSVLFESEGSFTPDFFTSCGGNPDTLLLYPADTCEDVFWYMAEICTMAEKDKVKQPIMIGWDGIAATGTKHLQETWLEKRDMSKAGVMSLGTQLVTTMVKRCNVCIVATNQTRTVIGDMSHDVHTPGGAAWPFHSSQRMELRFDGSTKGSIIYSGDTEVGRWSKGYVSKNKLASPFGRFTMPCYVYDSQGRYMHPEYGTELKKGVCIEESLYWTYMSGLCRLPDGLTHVLTSSGGWCKLHDYFTKGGEYSFRSKDWLGVLEKFPQLVTYPYEYLRSQHDRRKKLSQSIAGSSNTDTGSGEVSEISDQPNSTGDDAAGEG